ncbi:MAG: FAD-binding oxidoreductase [Archaeoglobaceae archaeon]|nr:FAD-binding oxidoreductase [Archaeoglobaceae archaeon]MDW8013171.1 FAD-binding oxidoreductase [Archaeoglobaceae archaeon]
MYEFPNVRVEVDPEVCKLYRFDLLKVPKPFSAFIRTPLAVFQPENVKDLLEILKFAKKRNLPLIPRGAATSAYGGVVPLKRSLIVDMNRMKNFEVENGKLIAESGAVWFEIERKINKKGYALRVYPTSALVSTVGGWIAQNGYGIGSLAYGSIAENVEWLEVVDFEGLKKVSGDELKFYVGAYGTTGIIVKACVKLRKNNPLGVEAFETSIDKAVEKIDNAYHAAYKNAEKKIFLLAREDGESNDLGLKAWKERFFPLTGYKSTFSNFSEVIVPIESVVDFLSEVEKISKHYQVNFARGEATILIILQSRNILKALKIIKIAEKYNGRPFGTGIFFKRKDKDFWDFKKKIDPKDLLNPKKLKGNLILNFAGLIAWIA